MKLSRRWRPFRMTFAAIQLEDISAPRCFEIEERLQAMLDIPVMHDDQHGTAVVSTAALMVAANRDRRGYQQSGHRSDRPGRSRERDRQDGHASDRQPGLGTDLSDDAVTRFVRDGGQNPV